MCRVEKEGLLPDIRWFNHSTTGYACTLYMLSLECCREFDNFNARRAISAGPVVVTIKLAVTRETVHIPKGIVCQFFDALRQAQAYHATTLDMTRAEERARDQRRVAPTCTLYSTL
jgi:hypothetical protein